MIDPDIAQSALCGSRSGLIRAIPGPHPCASLRGDAEASSKSASCRFLEPVGVRCYLPSASNTKKAPRGDLFLFGGEGGIRTPGPFRVNGFQDRRIRPLCHLSDSVASVADAARSLPLLWPRVERSRLGKDARSEFFLPNGVPINVRRGGQCWLSQTAARTPNWWTSWVEVDPNRHFFRNTLKIWRISRFFEAVSLPVVLKFALSPVSYRYGIAGLVPDARSRTF